MNIGRSYYRSYFLNTSERDRLNYEQILVDSDSVSDSIKKENRTAFQNRNKSYTTFQVRTRPEIQKLLVENEQINGHNTKLSFKTLYPGLLVGSGWHHETGMEGEYKLGIQFDHTTGLPYIPGHSVKGVIKAWLSMVMEEDETKQGPNSTKSNPLIAHYVQQVCKLKSEELHLVDWKKLISIFFNESPNGNSLYDADIFLDAFPDKGNGLLFADDYITPHKSPIDEPTPILFMLIREDVTLNFYFNLKDTVFSLGNKSVITASEKCEIFSQVICDAGVGAKTSVGYGRLTTDLDVYKGETFEYEQTNLYTNKQRDRRDDSFRKGNSSEHKGNVNRYPDNTGERKIIDERPKLELIQRTPESEQWPDINDLKINSLVEAKVLAFSGGNAKLQLYVRNCSELINCQGRFEAGAVYTVRIIEVSGKIGSPNYKINKVKA